MHIDREDLLKWRKLAEEQLQWIDSQLSQMESDSSQKESPENQKVKSLNSSAVLENKELDLIQPDHLSLPTPHKNPFNKIGCIFIALLITALFLGFFWILPQLLY